MGKLFCVPSLSFPLGINTLFVLCLLAHPSVFAQKTSEKDSLLQILPTLPEDTNKVNVLNRLSFLLKNNDSQSALLYGEKAFQLSKKMNFKRGLASSYLNRGYVFVSLKKFDEAAIFQEKAAELWIKLKDSLYFAQSIRELGIIHRKVGDFPVSLDYFLKALKVYEVLGEERKKAHVLASIGGVYYYQKDYSKSLEFHKKALQVHNLFDDKKSVAIDLNNIANVYADLKNYDQALIHYNDSKYIKESIGDKRGVAIALSNIASVYIEQKKFALAIRNCLESIKIRKELGSRSTYPLSYLSQAYVGLGEYDKAIFYASQALEISKETGAKNRSKVITGLLSDIYQKQGNYKNALKYYQKYKAYTDSVFNDTKSKQIAEMETKYDTEKKEQENKYLRLQDVKNKALIRQSFLLNILSVVGVVLLMILAVVLYRSNLRKQRTNRVLLLQKQEIEIQTEKLKITNRELKKANIFIKKDRDEKVKIYLQEAMEATNKLQQIHETLTQRGPEIAQKLLTNEINTAGKLTTIQEKVRIEFPGFSEEIDKALVDKKITKVIWQVGYCLKLGKPPTEIAKILPLSNRTVSVYGTKLRKMGVLEAITK